MLCTSVIDETSFTELYQLYSVNDIRHKKNWVLLDIITGAGAMQSFIALWN